MTMTEPEIRRHLNLAKDAALASGEMLKGLRERRIDSENGKDIKLAADKLSEEVIIEQYLAKDTDYDILSEERGLIKRGDSGYLWIVDPLDGSANFSREMDDLCCVSIALWKDGAPLLGVVYRFSKDDMYTGIVGSGAWKNDEEIHTSDVAYVNRAILATGFPVFSDYSEENLRAFVSDIRRFKKVRMLGTAAIMGVLVAEGKIDAYMEDGVMLWDIAASAAIATAAGAYVNDIKLPMDTDYRCKCMIFGNQRIATD